MSGYSGGFIGFTPLERAKAIDNLAELIEVREKNRERAENVRGYEAERDRTYDKFLKKPLDAILKEALILQDSRLSLKELEVIKIKNTATLNDAQRALAASPADVAIQEDVRYYQFKGALIDKKIKLEQTVDKYSKTKEESEKRVLAASIKSMQDDILEDEKKMQINFPGRDIEGQLADIKRTAQVQSAALSVATATAIQPQGKPIEVGTLKPSAKDLPTQEAFNPTDNSRKTRSANAPAKSAFQYIFDARNNGKAAKQYVWSGPSALVGQFTIFDKTTEPTFSPEFGPIVWYSQNGIPAEGCLNGTNFTFMAYVKNPDGSYTGSTGLMAPSISADLVAKLIKDPSWDSLGKDELKKIISAHLAIFGRWGRQYDPQSFATPGPINSATQHKDYQDIIEEITKAKTTPKSAQMGSGVRKPAAKKIDKESLKKEIISKMGPDGEYGDLIIDIPALYNTGRIIAVRKDEVGGAVLNEVAGEGLVGLLTKRVMKNTLAKANPATLKQLERLRKLAASPTKPTPKKPRGGQIIVSDAGDLAQRLKVATGIYDAGNRSAKNVELITELANALMKKGRMSPEKYRQTLERYTVK